MSRCPRSIPPDFGEVDPHGLPFLAIRDFLGLVRARYTQRQQGASQDEIVRLVGAGGALSQALGLVGLLDEVLAFGPGCANSS